MKNNIISEIFVALVLVTLLIVIMNPFNIWMPDMMHIVVLATVFIVFVIFATFILREKAVDEREVSHRMLAGRAGFLSGAIVLIVGIIVQAVHGPLDAWLILALVVMVLAKMAVRLYGDFKL